jgi:hypothetical protein
MTEPAAENMSYVYLAMGCVDCEGPERMIDTRSLTPDGFGILLSCQSCGRQFGWLRQVDIRPVPVGDGES